MVTECGGREPMGPAHPNPVSQGIIIEPWVGFGAPGTASLALVPDFANNFQSYLLFFLLKPLQESRVRITL